MLNELLRSESTEVSNESAIEGEKQQKGGRSKTGKSTSLIALEEPLADFELKIAERVKQMPGSENGVRFRTIYRSSHKMSAAKARNTFARLQYHGKARLEGDVYFPL